jgi:predicted outer membrane lipoprotein
MAMNEGSAASSPEDSPTPLVAGMRSPVVAPLTRFLLGVPLFFLATQTDDYFAWTIGVPLTAAFLGANYFASALLALFASRETIWAFGRVTVSVALVFAPLVTAATFIHLDQFDLDSVIGWIWVIAYGIYPPMLALFLFRQLRATGVDPPRLAPLPAWLRGILAVHAAVMIPLAVALFIAPSSVGDLWPWPLTPLTGRMVAAWTLAFGVLAAHQLWENDLERIKVALLVYPIFGALQVIALARYSDDMDFGDLSAWVYLTIIASTFVIGAFGWLELRRARERGGLRAISASGPTVAS